MAGNKDLSNAIKAKKDEFYTQLVDIEKEMKYYRDYFKGKTVFLNCDDPYESNFFKYFAMNFNRLGLKKLVSTCYKGSPVAQTQLPLFGDIETSKDGVRPYKIEITEVSDENNDGKIDLSDVEYLLQSDKNVLSVLDGDGDFRSEECVALLDEADVVITNPPFSLFREYISLLVDHNKDFIILGNQNAITYKETFPLIKENKVWLGASIHSGDREFRVPDTYPLNASGCRVDENGVKYIRVKGIRWFTNIDYKQRHENLILCEKYDPEKYPKYDNYDAIEVGKVVDIPCDYEEGYLVPVEYKQQLIDAGFTLGSERLDSSGNLCVCVCVDTTSLRKIVPEEQIQYCCGVIGVPITFLDKYDPTQFQILGATESEGKGFSNGIWNASSGITQPLINGNKKYKRLFIRKNVLSGAAV